MITFVTEETEFAADYYIIKQDLYERYKQWGKTAGHYTEGRNEFYARLEAHELGQKWQIVPTRRRLGGVEGDNQLRVFTGLRLKSIEQSTIRF